MRRAIRFALLVVSAATPMAGAAKAQIAAGAVGSTAEDFRAKFLRLDADGDAVLERDEIPEAGRAAFDRLLARGDANKDGKLGADETRALAEKLREAAAAGAAAAPGNGIGAARLKAMDKDGDGNVTKAEFTGPARLFTRLDADNDGTITKDEAAKFAPAETEDPKPKAKAAQAKPAFPRFKALDADGDGKISQAEFPRPKVFERLDADGDGFLAPAELAEMARGRAAKKP